MPNVTSRSPARLRCFALLASAAVFTIACSSSDSPPEGGAGSGGAPAAGNSNSSGSAGKGVAGAATGATGGTGGTGATGGSNMGGTGATTAGTGNTSGSTASAGSPASGGTTGMAGSGGTNAAGSGSGGAPVAGTGGSTAGATAGGMGGSGGAPMAGSGGAPMGGAGGAAPANFTCTQVIGLDSTGEWFTSGFETYVNDDKWQIIYHHPGYVETWGDPSSEDWDRSKAPITSPCKANSDNPDRVIFNMFADGSDTTSTALKDKASWMAGIQKVVTTLKSKYSNLKRVELLTMTRGPGNMACVSSNRSGSVVEQYTDDAVDASVTSGPPAVTSTMKFFAPDCTVFQDGGPHFTDAGKPIIAKLYGQYYSAEP